MDPNGAKIPAHRDPKGEAGARAPRVQYQQAFEFAPDSQLVTDGRGLILEANHATSDLLRCPKEFLIGKPLALFSTEGCRSRFYDAIGVLAQGGASDAFESRLARRGESPRDVYVIGWASHERPDALGGRLLNWLLRDLTDWKRAEAARSELQRRLATVQEDERRRIARDLHDTVGQTLTALTLGVRAVRDTTQLPSAAAERLEGVQRLVEELWNQVRELATRLRPTVLDDLGLEAAVRQLVADWTAHTGIAIDFQAVGMTDRFPPTVETALYRVIQEALTNAARHAGARRIAVVLGRHAGHAVAVIEDDGIGFDPELVTQTPTPGRNSDARSRLGLVGMRERVALLGGTLEIESAPGQATTIIARVPLVRNTPPSAVPEPPDKAAPSV
jgi:signal transduction histidine kinase